MTNYSFPGHSLEAVLFRLSKYCGHMRRLKALGDGSVISPFVRLVGCELISIGKHVRIATGTEIMAISVMDMSNTTGRSKLRTASILVKDASSPPQIGCG